LRGEKIEEAQLIEKVVHISRTAKVVKGGRRFSFSAVIVVGDGGGMVGSGLGKAKEVPVAIRKGIERAKKNMIMGSHNPHNIVKATLKGLSQLRSRETIAARRGKDPAEI
jgi:small subunit ribosomal protein S5